MKEKIEELLRETKREGVGSIIQFLSESDFYKAPASAMFHGNKPGGLAEHSYKVCNTMLHLNDKHELGYSRSTLILVGLLHDLCKINVYENNVLKTTGKQSEKKPYIRADKFPVGHGEKSVIIALRCGLELNEEEIIAIRYHMNMFDSAGYRDQNNWNNLSIFCFVADYFASTFLEV